MARASKAVVAGLALAFGALALLLATGVGRPASGASAATEPPFVAQRWDDDGTWRFEPVPDRFSPGALLDLRSLNEPVAGASGFVRSDGQGGFVRGDGQPLRFWAINSDVARRPFDKRPLWAGDAPDLARHARFLAKRGVNLVRMHRQIAPDLEHRPNAAIDDIDERERDAIWRMVAAMKREGIYSAISPYWAVPMKFSPAWGVAGGAQQSALGLLFFDPQLKAAYKTWLRKLLLPPNPYTGVPLARDASVALLQLQNEDSLLFWTAGAIAGPQRAALEARYAAFAQRKHGGIAQAVAAWGGERDAKDAGEAVPPTLALLDWWQMTQPPSSMKPGRAARLADQTEFLATTMRDFNREMVDYLKRDLGVGSLVNAGNWKTASAERLNDAERWSYGPGEVDAVNRYNAGLHTGTSPGWAVLAGDRYTSPSALFDSGLLPVNLRQSAGRPMLVSEGAWPMPHAWAIEAPLLVSAYSALNGVAGYLWFATDVEGYAPPRSANGYLPSQAKWDVATPEVMGQFPAAALIYRRGDVKPAPPALVERRSSAQLWRRDAPRLVERDGYDPNRDAGVGPRLGARDAEGALSPRVFLTGPVRVGFEADAGSTEVSAQATAALTDPQRTPSPTGELLLDHGLGLLRIDTPRAQGLVGSLQKAGPQRLADVEIDARDAYAAVVVVSLDELPIRDSARLLVQVATPARPQGWAERPVTIDLPEAKRGVPGRGIDSHGSAPWRVRKSAVTLRVAGTDLREAVVLDANGEAVSTRPLTQREAGGRSQVELAVPADAAWLLLRR